MSMVFVPAESLTLSTGYKLYQVSQKNGTGKTYWLGSFQIVIQGQSICRKKKKNGNYGRLSHSTMVNTTFMGAFFFSRDQLWKGRLKAAKYLLSLEQMYKQNKKEWSWEISCSRVHRTACLSMAVTQNIHEI